MALYGLVIGNGHKPGTFAFRRNKRDALRDAKQAGARVYIMRHEPQAGVWDAPTFIMSADEMLGYRCQRLPNGYVLVRDMAAGLETLYDPQTDALRGPSIHWAGHDLAAARAFVERGTR